MPSVVFLGSYEPFFSLIPATFKLPKGFGAKSVSFSFLGMKPSY